MHFTFRFFLKVKISGGVFGRPSGQKRMAVVANFLFVSFSPPTLKAKRPVGVEGALFFLLLLLPLHTRKRGKRASRGQQLGFSLSLPPLFLSYYRQTKIPSFVPWPYSRGPQAGNTISSNSSSSLYKPTTSSSSFHSLIFLFFFFSNWRPKRNLFLGWGFLFPFVCVVPPMFFCLANSFGKRKTGFIKIRFLHTRTYTG